MLQGIHKFSTSAILLFFFNIYFFRSIIILLPKKEKNHPQKTPVPKKENYYKLSAYRTVSLQLYETVLFSIKELFIKMTKTKSLAFLIKTESCLKNFRIFTSFCMELSTWSFSSEYTVIWAMHLFRFKYISSFWNCFCIFWMYQHRNGFRS